MEKPTLREDEIVTMHQLSNLTISLTNRISELRTMKRELEGSYSRIGLTFEYGGISDIFETPTIDITITVDTTSKPDPLKTAWGVFLKTAYEEIEKEIGEKLDQLKDIKEHFKKM